MQAIVDVSLHLIGSLGQGPVSLVSQGVYTRTQKQLKHSSLLARGLAALLSYVQNIEDSIAFDFGTPGSGVQVRHVTKGSNGFAQVSDQVTDSSNLNKWETYSFA
jgi:hypothetical protein